MKLKILDILISSNDEFLGELKEAIFNGKNSERANKSISFDSSESFNRLMTSNKIQILMAIARLQPDSINKLAKILNREYPHVLKDCKVLELLGFIKLNEKVSARKQLIPKLSFDYDVIRVKSSIEKMIPISEKSNYVLLTAKVS